MESNKDEAYRCLSIARRHRDAGNIPSALKFCQKSMALFSTLEAERLLQELNSATSSGPSETSTSASTSSTETHPSSAGAKHRHHGSTQNGNISRGGSGTASGMNGEKRDYTPEQHAVVKRVRSCNVTEYYEILELKRDCEDADIKRAYRKLALALHPDKNGAPGADEAFKLVSKAFQVLSDPQKRAVYDRSGGDPEDRFAGMSSPSTGFASSPFGNGATFEGELSPEDLFNMFFGGSGTGGLGGGFGGPVFTASFNTSGFQFMRAGGRPGQRGQRPNTAAANEPRSLLIQLMPLLLLFAFSFLSSLPSLFSFSPPPVPNPHFSFSQTKRYSIERRTSNLGIGYWVDPKEFWGHSVIGPELGRQGETVGKWQEVIDSWKQEEDAEETKSREDEANTKEDGTSLKAASKESKESKAALKAARRAARKKARAQRRAKKQSSSPALAKFEANVERVYTQDMYTDCQRGIERKERRKDAEVGVFGIGTDWDKVRAIEAEVVESCEILRELGVLR